MMYMIRKEGFHRYFFRAIGVRYNDTSPEAKDVCNHRYLGSQSLSNTKE